jgi:hypothetical protein
MWNDKAKCSCLSGRFALRRHAMGGMDSNSCSREQVDQVVHPVMMQCPASRSSARVCWEGGNNLHSIYPAELHLRIAPGKKLKSFDTAIWGIYEHVSKSFRTGRLKRELQMVQLSATRCGCIAILWVSQSSVVLLLN